MIYLPFADTISTMHSASVLPVVHTAFDMNLDPGPTSVRPSDLTTASMNADTKEQRWENLKPIIHQLFIKEEKTLEDVRIIMLLVYHFQKT